ncbi:putative ATP-dependent protease binding subunit [Trypanosoma cruzi]|uniref:Putative ATP-dependent protease binding subunit n=1 Tax=Trypanosoma cruzi TaxID=5693 RepID=A0A2V2V426_TRYCR|nr:putative ATP-dependent protease binding subunit [Trypanosoma cruzi]
MRVFPRAGRSEGAMAAAKLLEPSRARCELRTIAATFFEEYRENVETDAVLGRRFMPVHVTEPGVDGSTSIFRGLGECYETHRGAQMTDNLVGVAGRLADRHAASRFVPDKAIDPIDEACADVRVQLSSRQEEMDQLERTKRQLGIEAKAVGRDKKKKKLLQERLRIVKGDVWRVENPLLAQCNGVRQ